MLIEGFWVAKLGCAPVYSSLGAQTKASWAPRIVSPQVEHVRTICECFLWIYEGLTVYVVDSTNWSYDWSRERPQNTHRLGHSTGRIDQDIIHSSNPSLTLPGYL